MRMDEMNTTGPGPGIRVPVPQPPLFTRFPTQGHCRSHGLPRYNRHPIRRYRPTRYCLSFRLKIRL